MRARLTMLLAAAVTLLLPAPSYADPLPVPYYFLPSAVIGALPPNGNPPGANIWTCKPSTAHPRPVVLVHGLTGNKATNWQTYAPLLKNNGYCVFALTYGVNKSAPPVIDQLGGLNRMQDSAVELKAFIAKVLTATGARKVDIVGHSEGTVVPDYYVKFLGGAAKVKRYVSLAPLWHGTNPAGLDTISEIGSPFGVTAAVGQALDPYFASGPQLLAHSAFWTKLRSGGTPKVDGVEYTNIVTKYDELVQPYTSGIQPGMKNYVIQDFCATDYAEHFEIAADPVAARVVLNTLDPSHAKPVPCTLVLPFVGTV
jgi:triacylglycerol lipase